MMPFLGPYCHQAPAQATFSAGPSLATLFRLLDDFETYNQEAQQTRSSQPQTETGASAAAAPKPEQPQRKQRASATRCERPVRVPHFTPAFDVVETPTAYHLHGELPGIERENVSIEFTDPQTIVIRGRVERTYESSPATEAASETAAAPTDDVAMSGAAADETPTTDADETSSTGSGWHHATVEDDPEEPGTPTSTVAPTPKETPASPSKAVEKKPEQPVVPEKKKDKIWLYERSIGTFSRSFSFPSRVDQDAVSASLENGVLSVTVPKAKVQIRRIAVF